VEDSSTLKGSQANSTNVLINFSRQILGIELNASPCFPRVLDPWLHSVTLSGSD
jgi:hypothetical protein